MMINKASLGSVIPHSNGLKKKYERMQEYNKKQVNTDKIDYESLSDTDAKKISDVNSITQELAEKDYDGERIINKAHSGKQLDISEEKYLAEKYPDVYQKYKSAQVEREMMKQQMRNSQDKVGVAVAFSNSTDKADKESQDDWEREMRINQLNDEYEEYRKTDEYKEKDDCIDPLGMYDEEREEYKGKRHINKLA